MHMHMPCPHDRGSRAHMHMHMPCPHDRGSRAHAMPLCCCDMHMPKTNSTCRCTCRRSMAGARAFRRCCLCCARAAAHATAQELWATAETDRAPRDPRHCTGLTSRHGGRRSRSSTRTSTVMILISRSKDEINASLRAGRHIERSFHHLPRSASAGLPDDAHAGPRAARTVSSTIWSMRKPDNLQASSRLDHRCTYTCASA